MMNLPRPMLILFGAGATRAAYEKGDPPPPLDIDFFEIALQITKRGTGYLAKRVAKDVHELYGRVIGVGLEQYFRDIETRDDLAKFAKPPNRPMDWNARRRRLEELIRRVLVQTTCEMSVGPARAKPSRLHQQILKKLQEHDVLMTFNYDTVIEESMPVKTSLWTPRFGYGIDITGVRGDWSKNWYTYHSIDSREVSRVKLLKLHGSINWHLYTNKMPSLKKRPYLVSTRNNRPRSERAAFLPPGWHKRIDRQPYSSIWRNARLALEKCASLVIIGYSLPDTDLIARALFLETARRRNAVGKYLAELHIADVNEVTRQRIIDLVTPALGPTGKVFRYNSAAQLAQSWR
jgi:hypothetical protein